MLNRPTVYLLYVQHLSGFSCFPELTQLHADLVCYIGPIGGEASYNPVCEHD